MISTCQYFLVNSQEMYSYNITSECAATSVGEANQAIFTLLQLLSSAYCNISSSTMWPQDHGEFVLENGTLFKYNKEIMKKN